MSSRQVADEKEEVREFSAEIIPLSPAGPPSTPIGKKRVLVQPPRRHAARAPLPGVLAVAIWALVSVGALAVWGLLYVSVLSAAQEHRSQRVLYATFREELAAGTVPTSGTIAHRLPVAMLQMPSISVRNLIVVEGTTSGDLQAGPGHRRDTPLPGEVGTSFLLGRASAFGGPFRAITDLSKGDKIGVTTGEGTFDFLVDALRRPGDPLSAFDQSAARLTLVTSEATKGGLRQVVYVDATLKGQGQPASEGRPNTLAVAERQLHGDQGAWLGIVLWLEVMLAAVVALSWASARWGLKPTLIVGVPIVLAAAWGVAEGVSQLLPNIV